jgi:hypothetical protein
MLSDLFGNELPKACRHLKRNRTPSADGGWVCVCGKATQGGVARKGRQIRNYGNRAELDAARKYGGDKIGQAGGPVDIRGKDWETQMKTHRRSVPKEWETVFAKMAASRGKRGQRLLLRFVGKPGQAPQDFFVVPAEEWIQRFGKDE